MMTISFEPVHKFNRNERHVGDVHSLQVDTFLVIFEIGICLASVNSSLIAGQKEKDTSEWVKDAC